MRQAIMPARERKSRRDWTRNNSLRGKLALVMTQSCSQQRCSISRSPHSGETKGVPGMSTSHVIAKKGRRQTDMPRPRRLCAVLCALLGCSAAESTAAGVVTSCADDGSPGTLRSQLATSGDGVVDLYSSLPLSCSTITLTQGELSFAGEFALEGPTDRKLAIVGNGSSRVLSQTLPNSIMGIYNLTVSGGRNTGSAALQTGGCISSTGSIVLRNSTITDCRVTGDGLALGGAAFAFNHPGMIDSHISDSSASSTSNSFGGGAYASQFNCTDSTITGNFAVNSSVTGGGGGVYASNAQLSGCTFDGNNPGGLFAKGVAGTPVNGSTFSNNTGGSAILVAGRHALAITGSTISGNSGGSGVNAPDAAITISNSTIFGNSGSGSGGGVYSSGGVYAKSSIFANNLPYDIYCGRSTVYGMNNLVVFTNATDQSHTPPAPGVIVSSDNPRLAPLGFHGGKTRTHALLAGSPAIDHGENSAALMTDQRGAPRESPLGKPDIGAYERQANDDELFYDGFG
jgi:hypothetical protein